MRPSVSDQRILSGVAAPSAVRRLHARARSSCARALVLLAASALGGCATLSDQPDAVRHDKVPWAPLFSPFYARSVSEDGSSWRWSSLLWLVGQDVEAQRRTSWALPFYWREVDPPYVETTMVFPLWFERLGHESTFRFITPLYGYSSTPESRTDYAVLNVFDWERSRTGDAWRSGLFLVYDAEHRGPRTDLTLVPIIGMSVPLGHLARFQWGYPAQGVTVGALGRTSSRRIELANLLGFFTLFGYDDVGDRREVRVGTLFSNEVLSIFRSWRGRGEDPFVREWLFPLYMNVQDADGGWSYVGPLWGDRSDHVAGTHTDWWLLGLLSRSTSAEGVTWSVAGFTVSGP